MQGTEVNKSTVKIDVGGIPNSVSNDHVMNYSDVMTRLREQCIMAGAKQRAPGRKSTETDHHHDQNWRQKIVHKSTHTVIQHVHLVQKGRVWTKIFCYLNTLQPKPQNN